MREINIEDAHQTDITQVVASEIDVLDVQFKELRRIPNQSRRFIWFLNTQPHARDRQIGIIILFV